MPRRCDTYSPTILCSFIIQMDHDAEHDDIEGRVHQLPSQFQVTGFGSPLPYIIVDIATHETTSPTSVRFQVTIEHNEAYIPRSHRLHC